VSDVYQTLTAPPIYYAAFLDLRGKRCLVVGGGTVAQRKVAGLLDAGAIVTVVAPNIVPMPDGVHIEQRTFIPQDLNGMMLVIAATNDSAANAAVAREANARGIFINVVDDPAICSMILPAVVRREAFCLAISTGGASPVLARRLKESFETQFGEEYGLLIDLLWRLRRQWEPKALDTPLPMEARRQAWEQVLDLPLLDMLRAGDAVAAEIAAMRILDSVLTQEVEED